MDFHEKWWNLQQNGEKLTRWCDRLSPLLSFMPCITNSLIWRLLERIYCFSSYEEAKFVQIWESSFRLASVFKLFKLFRKEKHFKPKSAEWNGEGALRMTEFHNEWVPVVRCNFINREWCNWNALQWARIGRNSNTTQHDNNNKSKFLTLYVYTINKLFVT